MSFFGSVFGSSSYKYSNDQHPLPEREIKLLVSRVKIRTLDQNEEALVEQEIMNARVGDGKISLRQIEEVFRGLYNNRKISINDKKSLIKVFEEYFKDKFRE